MKTYIFHTDPGHGWLAVKRQELAQLRISDRITPYSYTRGDTVYLEEDCDLATFFQAYEQQFGHRPQYREIHRERTPIRGYDRYTLDN